jgi:hypothetical protein
LQLNVIAEQFKGDPIVLHAIVAGALAGVASFSLMVAKPGSHREMEAHIKSIVPWAFDQAAGMLPPQKMDS